MSPIEQRYNRVHATKKLQISNFALYAILFWIFPTITKLFILCSMNFWHSTVCAHRKCTSKHQTIEVKTFSDCIRYLKIENKFVYLAWNTIQNNPLWKFANWLIKTIRLHFNRAIVIRAVSLSNNDNSKSAAKWQLCASMCIIFEQFFLSFVRSVLILVEMRVCFVLPFTVHCSLCLFDKYKTYCQSMCIVEDFSNNHLSRWKTSSALIR